jgi:hypothetical protein
MTNKTKGNAVYWEQIISIIFIIIGLYIWLVIMQNAIGKQTYNSIEGLGAIFGIVTSSILFVVGLLGLVKNWGEKNGG